MTELLQQAIERVRELPLETQDAFARVLLELAGGDGNVYELSPEEESDLISADEEVARGEFAEDSDVAAVFAKYDR